MLKKQRTTNIHGVNMNENIVMLVRCDICTVGVGESRYKDYKTQEWKTHKHTNEKSYTYDYDGRVLTLCQSCYDDIQKQEDKDKYVKEQFKLKDI